MSPTAPPTSAAPAQTSTCSDGICSARSHAKSSIVARDASFDTAATVKTGARLVARPPLKSPAPHDVADARPKTPEARGEVNAGSAACGGPVRSSRAYAPEDSPDDAGPDPSDAGRHLKFGWRAAVTSSSQEDCQYVRE